MDINFKMLGKMISKRRRELGLKQNEMAEKADIANNYLSNIENGRSIPSITTFATICSVLNCTPNDILLGVMTSNDISADLIGKLMLCDKNSLEKIDFYTNYVLECQKNKK